MVLVGMRFIKARFHVDFGPEALFDRVHYKMDHVKAIGTRANHFIERAVQRRIPQDVLDKITSFNAMEWELVTCEVRVDTGKFVNSTWEIFYDGERYWLTVGLGNVAETIIRKSGDDMDKIVRGGDLYDYVRAVNRGLMEDVRPGHSGEKWLS